MIAKFNGYNPARNTAAPMEQIPTGAYVAEIRDAEVHHGFLTLLLDIAEGPHAGYYTRCYENACSDPFKSKRWKGRFGLRIPVEDTDFFERDTVRFNEAMWLIMDSNPGYEWNWDENSLKGKKVGITIREAEYDFNGYQGITREIGRLEQVDEVRSGKTHPMRRRLLPRKETGTVSSPAVAADQVPLTGTDDLFPF